MTKIKNTPETTKSNKSSQNIDDNSKLESIEEVIFRMRFGIGKSPETEPCDRNINEELRKKLQFLELKAFEQSGRINELIGEFEKKKTPKQ